MTEGERVKMVRKEQGLTLEKFGKQFGMGASSISDIENGRRTLTNQTRISICREFGVNEAWLRTGEGDMFVPLTRSQEITEFVGKILKGDDDNFKRRFIAILAELDEAEWELIEKMAIKLARETKKD